MGQNKVRNLTVISNKIANNMFHLYLKRDARGGEKRKTSAFIGGAKRLSETLKKEEGKKLGGRT